MNPVLLILEWHRIGDAILSLPFLRGAAGRFDVRVICSRITGPVFESVLLPPQVITCDPPWDGGGWRGWSRCLQIIRKQAPDIIASVWADARVHALMAASGARRRIGFPMTTTNYYASQVPWRKRNLHMGVALSKVAGLALARPLLTEPLHRHDPFQPHLQAWRQVAHALETQWMDATPWMAVPPYGQKLPDYHPLWLVHPGAQKAIRQWPMDRFLSVVRKMIDAGKPIVTVKPPDSPGLSIEHPLIHPVAPSSFMELAALVNRVDAVLCNDTAVGHLAAALGRKVVSIFGPMEPRLYAPYGNESHVAVQDVCPWRPCLDSCRMPSPICMEAVTVKQVLDSITSVEQELTSAPMKSGKPR